MIIEKLIIHNYKVFKDLVIPFNDDINILVGNNEAGKSTIIEAIYLALTKRLNGRYLENEINNFIFNEKLVQEWISACKRDKAIHEFNSYIEIYIKNEKNSHQRLKGINNSLELDSYGIRLEISLNTSLVNEYEESIFCDSPSVPIEYFNIYWRGFDGNPIETTTLSKPSLIDASYIKLNNGADYYLQDIIQNSLDIDERNQLSFEYRRLKEDFSGTNSIKKINKKVNSLSSGITDKKLSIALDLSQKSNWQTNVIPHLNKIPLQQSGKGEQNSLKIMIALSRKSTQNSNTILIEEPENHLSFSSMRNLMDKITSHCQNKQLFITTHSSFVLNKLGLDKLKLINKNYQTSFNQLETETLNFFKKLSGFDTLRLVLSEKVILVEGPSDELILQKIYFQEHGKLPVDDKIDVISVGLTFKRFLDIAKKLNKKVAVVRDNDRNYQKNIIDRYVGYRSNLIEIFSSTNNTLNTLEPCIIDANTSETLSKIFPDIAEQDLQHYAEENKTEFALRIFDSKETITSPKYIKDAIKFIRK